MLVSPLSTKKRGGNRREIGRLELDATRIIGRQSRREFEKRRVIMRAYRIQDRWRRGARGAVKPWDMTVRARGTRQEKHRRFIRMELRCLHGDFCSRLFNRGTRSTAKKYIYIYVYIYIYMYIPTRRRATSSSSDEFRSPPLAPATLFRDPPPSAALPADPARSYNRCVRLAEMNNESTVLRIYAQTDARDYSVLVPLFSSFLPCESTSSSSSLDL